MKARVTRANLQSIFTFALDRAAAAGLNTDGWRLDPGKASYGYRYEIVGPDVHLDLGATAREAHLTLTALAAGWHLVAGREQRLAAEQVN